jgi:hypothetical protein
MKRYYSIIPPFHYSWLGYAEWVAENPLQKMVSQGDFFGLHRLRSSHLKTPKHQTSWVVGMVNP